MVSESPKLLHAIVHECDRQLRNASQPLPPKFHKVYAESLSMLSVFAKKKKSSKPHNKTIPEESVASSSSGTTDSPEDFLLAAIERAEIALETYPKSIDLLALRCETFLSLVELKLKHSSKSSKDVEGCIYSIQSAINDYDKAHDLFTTLNIEEKSSQTEVTDDRLLRILTRMSKVFETTLETEFISARCPEYYTWIETHLQTELSLNPSLSILKRILGELYLARANPYLAISEMRFESDDSSEESRNEEEEALASAQEFLRKALLLLLEYESSADRQILVLVSIQPF